VKEATTPHPPDVAASWASKKSPSSGSLLAFFAATYAVTWTCFIPVVVAVPAHTPLGTLLVFLGTIAPSGVALWLTARAEGRPGARALLTRTLQWRVAARWYVFAVGYIVAVKLVVALLHRVVSGEWPHFDNLPWYVVPAAIAISTPIQAGEEIGWRGYALPRLAARLGLAGASILLGVIWACWHLPLFFVRGADTYGQSFLVYLLQVTALSVAMAWLYAHTQGSLLLTMLMHAAVNNSKHVVPPPAPSAAHTFGLNASLAAWLAVALLWICAVYFLVRMPREASAPTVKA
jgi:membrane protease YdiL (CAAX protease family)